MIALVLCFWAAPALAQVVPPSVDSGRIGKQLEKTPEPTGGDLFAREGKARERGVPRGSGNIRIKVRSVRIAGATVYSAAELSRFSRGVSGRSVPLTGIYGLVERIEEKYRADGFILARVQVRGEGLKDGRVTFLVAEGRVSSVRIDNPEKLHDAAIDGIADRIRAIDPFNIRRLEREMLLLSDLFGVTGHAVLVPGNTAGSIGIEVKIEKTSASPFHTQLSFDNYGSRYLGPYEVSAAEQTGNVFLPHDRVNLTLFGSVPPEKLRFLTASYLAPVGSNGTSLGLSGSYGETAPGFTLAPKDVRGSSNSVGIDFSQNLIRSRERNLSFTTNLSVKEASSQILSQQLYDDRLRTLKMGVSYDDADALGGADAVQISATQGLAILGASRPGAANLSRAEGRSDFTKLELVLSRSQNLPYSFSGLFSFAGQYALEPLLSAEQFGYGGQSFGRGYDPSQITGDSGVSGLFELRYGGVPDFLRVAAQPYAFYDLGKVWNIHSVGESGASVGVGVRFANSSGANANLSLAKPLTRRVEDPVYGDGKAIRLLFSLGCVF
jgi:hemolysin activation/secretion protein